MKVRIEVAGGLQKFVAGLGTNGSRDLFVEAPISLQYLLNNALSLKHVDKVVLVNGKYVAPDYSLHDGDSVQIFAPLPGG